MPKTRRVVTSPRKAPVQERSARLVADILKAAIRVLEREGAARFTTIRVAEVAGVSVGSLYQYFPNKQSILFRLQLDEWGQTAEMIEGLLEDRSRTPAERLRATTRAFFRSECDEAPLRRALDAVAPTYHDAPEAEHHRRRSSRVVAAFIREAAPHASPKQQRSAAELLKMMLSAIGKEVSERDPSEAERDAWADAVASMAHAHLTSLRG